MKTPQKHSALLVAFALVALPAAFANDDQDVAKKFQKLDKDGDGRISSAEYTSANTEKKHWWNRSSGNSEQAGAKSTEQFTQLDKDNDGFLTATELAAHIEQESGSGNSPTGRSGDYSPREQSSPATSTDSSVNSTSGGVSGASNSNGNGNATTSSSTDNSSSSAATQGSPRTGNSDGTDRTK